ncbi:hypothetical protein TSUD_82420 [Trifolium subterraneum]|uniref:HD-Zip IV C-terminal domain-containing protein n=1 Tax=Trifolium subterraneum TaxID=3900 RepID=A0A2Z6P6C0_TRISU|nr:hypothetical protein TSUD_82420 [Trifolium subterraneum]
MSSNKDFPELNTLDNDGVRVIVRKCRDPGTENGAILTATTSFWLSCTPQHAFNFLKDNSRRFQWDILCEGHHQVEELHRITYGTNPGNFTSIIRTLNPEDKDMRILQECYANGMESGLGEEAGVSCEGSVVTVAYQLLIGTPAEIDNPDLDAVKKMNKFVTSTVNNIRHALKCSSF